MSDELTIENLEKMEMELLYAQVCEAINNGGKLSLDNYVTKGLTIEQIRERYIALVGVEPTMPSKFCPLCGNPTTSKLVCRECLDKYTKESNEWIA